MDEYFTTLLPEDRKENLQKPKTLWIDDKDGNWYRELSN